MPGNTHLVGRHGEVRIRRSAEASDLAGELPLIAHEPVIRAAEFQGQGLPLNRAARVQVKWVSALIATAIDRRGCANAVLAVVQGFRLVVVVGGSVCSGGLKQVCHGALA